MVLTMMKEFNSIEKSTEDTFYRDSFFPCKTLMLQSVDGRKRCFVECSEATDCDLDIWPIFDNLDIALHNTVRRLLVEKDDAFFFPEADEKAHPVVVDGDEYHLCYEDITEEWTNHYWVRARRPIIGYKGVSKNYKSTYGSEKYDNRQYKAGETVITEERLMLDSDVPGNGCFFSPDVEKALSYVRDGGKLLLVAASGLIFVKNRWNDLAASSLTIVREITKEEVSLLRPATYTPKYMWGGKRWYMCYDD